MSNIPPEANAVPDIPTPIWTLYTILPMEGYPVSAWALFFAKEMLGAMGISPCGLQRTPAGQIILGAYSESDKKFHGVYATRTPPRGQVDTDGVLAKAVELSQDQLAEIQAVVAPHMNIAGFVSRLATVGLLPTEVPPEMLKLVSAAGSA